jgi:uncharacterized repeat protein (TIGR01451 family)
MRQLFTALFVCFFLSSTLAQSTVYVTPTGSGNQSGGSWSDAISGTQLQSRLASATAGAMFALKSGLYKPTTGTDRTISFTIPSGVRLVGGFTGTENVSNAYVPITPPSSTTLSGEIGDPNQTSDNSYHVVKFVEARSAGTTLSSVVITGGNANASNSSYETWGGGVLNISLTSGVSSIPLIDRCTFVNNQAEWGGAIANIAQNGGQASPVIVNCSFKNNVAQTAGALYNFTGNGILKPYIVSCTFEDNIASTYNGGAIQCQGSNNANGIANMDLVNCRFIRNKGDYGGAVFVSGFYGQAKPTFTGCIFSDNTATNNGGAVSSSGFYGGVASPTFTNCLFSRNTAAKGAAVFNEGNNGTCQPEFRSCTITNNYPPSNITDSGTGALFNASSSSGFTGTCTPKLTNCILWENSGVSASNRSGIVNEGGATTTITYSDVQTGYSGTGNLNQDPFFVNPKADNFRLLSISPVINMGDPATSTSNGSSADLDSSARIVSSRIDMGAYEFKDRFGAGTIVYVTPNGNGNNSGSSWANALPGRNLQQATVETRNGTIFWVATGVYKPTSGTDRNQSFWVPYDGQLYGGFNGSETNVDQRNVLANPTVLSGDIGATGDRADNTYTVVRFRNASASTRLDGVTVRDGNADNGKGGGIYCDGRGQNNKCEPTIYNCLVTGNNAQYGGGLANDGEQGNASPTVVNCIFSQNSASIGGGAYNAGLPGASSPTYTNCRFEKNSTSGQGGGLYFYAYFGTAGTDILRLTNCTILDNMAFEGGGLFCGNSISASMNVLVTNCLFSRNYASKQGGAISLNRYPSASLSATIKNSTLVNNQAPTGGSFFSYSSSGTTGTYTFVNTIIRNGGFSYSAESNTIPPTYNVTYSNIEGGYSGTGNIDADPQFADAANGDYRLKAGSPSINTGDPASTTATVSATDLAGNQRVAENRIDMGAYEFQVSAVTGSDLSLRLSVDSRTPSANQAVTYQLTVTNDGPIKATGVTWQNRLPNNMSFVGGSNLSLNNGVLSGYVASLEPGASNTFTYQLQPIQVGQYINAAQITAADQSDPDSQPNSGTGDGQDDAAQVDIRVGGASSPVYASANPNQVPLPPVQSNQPTPDPSKVDLTLSMSVDNRTPRIGDLLTYVLTITNQGGATASNVRVTAYLPDGQEFAGSGDGLSVSDGGVSGGTASIPAGGQVSVRFTARVTASKMGITKAQIRQASPADVDSTPDNGTDNGEDDTAQVDLRSLTGL